MTSNVPTTAETQKSGPTTSKPELSSGGTDEAITPRKRRLSVQEKADRILLERRLRVVKVDRNLIVAECRGISGAIYNLGHDPRKMQYRCTCPAMGPCSHLFALQSVVAVER